MKTHVPFTDFSLGIASRKNDFSIENMELFYSNFFKNVKSFYKSTIDIQFSKCKVYKINFDAPIIIEGVGKFSTLPFSSTLCSSDETFYLLMHIGDDHQIGSAAISFIKSSDEYQQLGGGRFRSKNNNIILSFEEDELDKYYLLVTSNPDLLTIDPLFNFARQVIFEH